MNLEILEKNLKNTIAAKESYASSLSKSENELVQSITLQFLEINLQELKGILIDVQKIKENQGN